MVKRIAAVKARQNLGALLDEVKLTGAEYLIERAGEPAAAVIPLEAYARCQRERSEAFDRIDALKRRLGQRTTAAPTLRASLLIAVLTFPFCE